MRHATGIRPRTRRARAAPRLAGAAALLLVAAGCLPAGSSPGLTLGAIYPTSGTQGPGGLQEHRGVELAVAMVNETGGVDGRRVEVVLEPTDVAEAAPSAVERLARRGIEIILGSYGSTISRRVAEAAERHGLLFWETGAVGELGMLPAAGETVFRFPASGGTLGRAAVEFVHEQIGAALTPGETLRYAVAYVDDEYGRSVGLGALEEIEDRGIPLAATLPYDLPTADYDAMAARLVEAGTDVLVVSSYLEDAIALRRATIRAGLRLVASIGTSSSYCMVAFGQLLGEEAVGLLASDKPTGEVLDPAALAPGAGAVLAEARTAYRERYGEPMEAPALSGFAAAWALLRHVLPEATELSPAAAAKAARAADLPSGSLPDGSGLRFAPPGHPDAGANIRGVTVIWQWVAPETQAVVWPPGLASEPPVLMRPR